MNKRFDQEYIEARREKTGHSTRQIMTAPSGAIYVCVNQSHISYCKSQAAKIGRTDLTFVSPDYLTEQNLRGGSKNYILDHATVLSESQLSALTNVQRKRPI